MAGPGSGRRLPWGLSMPSLSAFLKPVRFHGADAADYRDKAMQRDSIALRLLSTFIILALSSRLFIEWNLFPEVVGTGMPYRLGAIAIMLVLFAVSFHRRFGRFFHGLVGTGVFSVAVLTGLANAQAPALFPYAAPGAWMIILLLGILSFGARLVILEVVLAVALPTVAVPLSNLQPDPLSTLIPLSVLTTALGLAMSYTLDQHWRRLFQRDLDLATSNEEQRLTHRKLAEAYATLKETQAQLVQAEKTAALGRLVANVAHRINTPIGNVVALASHLDESLRHFSDAVEKGGIRRSDLTSFLAAMAEGNGIVLVNAQRTAGLIDMFKRLVADAGERPGRLDVDDLLAGIRPSLEAMMTPGVTLAVDACPGLAIMAPWHVMEAVVGELVRNAVTHAFPGGRSGTVTIQARAADGDGVELQVIDNGQGIPCEHLEHVFDPFYTDGTIGGGHGLGLSTVHNAVAGPLGGRIAIDSRDGQGTTVTIRLPAAKAEEPETCGAYSKRSLG